MQIPSNSIFVCSTHRYSVKLKSGDCEGLFQNLHAEFSELVHGGFSGVVWTIVLLSV